jgi:uncharacterized protein DUF5660
MNSFTSGQNTSQKRSQSTQHNPLARALAEVEKKGQTEDIPGDNKSKIKPALNKSGSLFNADQNSKSGEKTFNPLNFTNSNEFKEKQAKELKKKQMREKLHRMVNPVEQADVFDAREEQTKKRINEIRIELKGLATDIAAFYKEVDISLTQEVRSTGISGTYHENFFAKLKEFIIMLRQKVSSAHTWARQAKAKNKKKVNKYGLDFNNNEAKAVHDVFHHERSSSYGA